VDGTLQLAGHPEVFVIGDLAAVEQNGEQLPQLIPPAMQEARHVARTILRLLAGERAEPFRYADPGMMATIGRNAAVAEIGPLRMSGFPGWVLWLGFHLLQIVTFRSKLVVLVNWAWNYFFLDRPVRLLLRADDHLAKRADAVGRLD
jgi:NADH dehydrogenase